MFRKLLWGFALCLSVSAARADAPAPAKPVETIPVQTFFTYAKVSAAKISPDGKYLAMAIANDKSGLEKNVFVIIGVDDMKAKARIDMVGDDSVENFWWANDKRVLVEAQTKSGGLDIPVSYGKLYGVNIDGTQQKLLMPYNPNDDRDSHMHQSVSSVVYFGEMLYHDPVRDPKHIVFQGYEYEGQSAYFHQLPKAFLLDVYTGQMREIASGGERTGGLVADNDGAVRITYGTDDKGYPKLFYRASGDTLDWKDLSSLIRFEEDFFVESTPLSFAPGNKRFYMLARSKDSTLGLYLVDPDTQAMEPVFEDPGYDVNGLVWSFRTDNAEHVVAVDTMPGLPKINVVDADDPMVDHIARLYDAFPGQQVHVTSYTQDHTKAVIFVASDKNPGDFYLYDTKSSQVRFLFAVKPEIDPEKMATMMPITITARDGVVLHGYLTMPTGVTDKNLPLIVNPHGGPHGPRDEWFFNPEVQLLANRGYAVLQLNYRGSGGYGLKFQQMGYHHWSSTMQDDLADGVDWAVKQGYVDPKRVCIYGASYGGYAAFENPIRYPDLYKCAVGYVGAYDLTLLGERGDVSHVAGGSAAMDSFLGSDMEERKRESPAYNADKLTIPVMIAYGGSDVRVVPLHAQHMMAALDKLGKKYEGPVYFPNEMHGFVNEKHNFDFYAQMLAFFDKYIGPDAAKAPPAGKD